MENTIKNYLRIMIVVVGIFVVIALTAPSFAAEKTLISRTSSGHTFTKAWKASVSVTHSAGKKSYLTYGFKKSTNRDFAYADSTAYKHRARLTNSNGMFNGPWKNANAGWSNLEVTHKGNTIKYYCIGTGSIL